MSTKNILAYFSPKINTERVVEAFELAFNPPACQPNGDNPAEWLQAKISQYEAKVSQLEAELKHTRVLLRGHQTWLADVKRRGAK